jgi:hypothetical protein
MAAARAQAGLAAAAVTNVPERTFACPAAAASVASPVISEVSRMRNPARWVCVVVAVLMSAGVARGAATSIFDDDWTPPRASEAPARPAAPADVVPGTPPVKPAVAPESSSGRKDPRPAPPVGVGTPVIGEVLARRAIPTRPEQAPVRKLMKEVFAAQLADRTPPARRKLAATLLEESEKAKSVPVDQFVLTAAAIDSALEAGDVPLAFRAADRLADSYDVDALQTKIAAAGKFDARSAPAGTAAENVAAGLSLVDELTAAEDYAGASKLCGVVQTWAAADAALRPQVQKQSREVGLLRETHERFARDTEKLKRMPDDPAANGSVGRYLCFVKGDWARGMPMLAKGSDPALKALAARENAAGGGGATGEAAIALADAWWAASVRQADTLAKAATAKHAAALYAKGVASLTGMRRLQVEQRIVDAGKMAGGGVAKPAAPRFMRPEEVLARFTFPDKPFQINKDGSLSGHTGDIDKVKSHVWLTNPQAVDAFEFGFEIKARAYQLLAVDIDGQTYRFSRGHLGVGHKTLITVDGKGRQVVDGDVTKPEEWNAIRVVVGGERMTFYYNGEQAGTCDLITPMSKASQVKVGFTSHQADISVRNVFFNKM